MRVAAHDEDRLKAALRLSTRQQFDHLLGGAWLYLSPEMALTKRGQRRIISTGPAIHVRLSIAAHSEWM